MWLLGLSQRYVFIYLHKAASYILSSWKLPILPSKSNQNKIFSLQNTFTRWPFFTHSDGSSLKLFTCAPLTSWVSVTCFQIPCWLFYLPGALAPKRKMDSQPASHTVWADHTGEAMVLSERPGEHNSLHLASSGKVPQRRSPAGVWTPCELGEAVGRWTMKRREVLREGISMRQFAILRSGGRTALNSI